MTIGPQFDMYGTVLSSSIIDAAILEGMTGLLGASLGLRFGVSPFPLAAGRSPAFRVVGLIA